MTLFEMTKLGKNSIIYLTCKKEDMEIKLKVKEYLIKLRFEPYSFGYSDSRNAIAIGLYVHNSKKVFNS